MIAHSPGSSSHLVGWLPPAAPSRLTYQAVASTGRRKAVQCKTLAEDAHLSGQKRQQLTATTRDAMRNFAIAAWVVRKHLDYVTAFTFQAKTADKALNEDIEAMVREKSRAPNAHLAARHPLRRLIRMGEARRVIDGDVAFEKIAPPGPWRGKLNTIESDLIHTAADLQLPKDQIWVAGCRLDRTGRVLEYAIAQREGAARRHHKRVPARHLYLHAYWDATYRFDQVRGISPLAAALNSLRDVAEGIDLALMRARLAQMFGLKITSTSDDLEPQTSGEPTEDTDDDGTADAKYELDLNKGPFQLELDPGEDADFLESKTPALETVNFLKLVIHVALKSIDVPYSFFDEAHTNFFGSRGALLHYLRSCKTKIEDNQDLLDWITAWWLGLWVLDGDLVLPRRMAFADLKWDWVADGVPWWDPAKEVRGHGMAIGAHLDNLERVCRSNSTDVYENIDINARVMAYARERGVPLVLPGVSATANLLDELQEIVTDA